MVFYMSSLQETQRCPLGEGPLGNDFPREARPLQGALPSGTSRPQATPGVASGFPRPAGWERASRGSGEGKPDFWNNSRCDSHPGRCVRTELLT